MLWFPEIWRIWWPYFDEVLFFLLALLPFVSSLHQWNVWYEEKPFFMFLVTSCSVKCILLLAFFLFLFLMPYCASLSSSPCSSQFSSSTFIPHRMKYVLPKRIWKSPEWDHLLCCICPALAFPKNPVNSMNSKYGHNWKCTQRIHDIISENELKQLWLS